MMANNQKIIIQPWLTENYLQLQGCIANLEDEDSHGDDSDEESDHKTSSRDAKTS